MIESSVVVLTSAAARPVESSAASSVSYPYFTLDNVHKYSIKQLHLLEVVSSNFRDHKNHIGRENSVIFTSPRYVHSKKVK